MGVSSRLRMGLLGIAAAAGELALAGCGGADTGTVPAADRQSASVVADPQAGAAAALGAFYDRVAAADWPGACALLDETWHAAMLRERGQACEGWLTEEFDEHRRARLSGAGVRVDPAGIEVSGKDAKVSASALSVRLEHDEVLQHTGLRQVDGTWLLVHVG